MGPRHAPRRQQLGASSSASTILAGIGFTMSLFIGMLAFPEPEHAADIRIGVLAGSICAAVIGYLMLSRMQPAHPHSGANATATDGRKKAGASFRPFHCLRSVLQSA